MSEKTSRSARSGRRSRRRLVIWLTFAFVGILMGAVWATGFATIGGTKDPGSTGSPALRSAGGAPQSSALAGTATPGSNLTVTWAGRWGSTAATSFYTVNLNSLPAVNNYNVAMLLTGGFDPTAAGWESMQLKVELKDVTSSGDCSDPSVFDGSNAHVMYLDNQDAGVYWPALAGGTTYCIGIEASNGQDTTGTFLRSATDTVPTVYPSFVATVDRG
jgi:hypothetical protein